MGIFNLFKKKNKNTQKKEMERKDIKISKKDIKISKIELFLDYGSVPIWPTEDGGIRSPFIPYEWADDEVLIDLCDKLSSQYLALFINNEREFSYFGFKDEQQKAEMKKTIDEFVDYVNKKNNGKYEVINYLDADVWKINTWDLMKKYIKKIEYLDKDAKECEITLNDGTYEILCFSHPYREDTNKDIYADMVSNVMIAEKREYMAKNNGGFAHSLCGLLVSRKRGEVKVGEFIIQIEEGLPKDIKDGEFIQFDCEKLKIH